MAVSGIKSEAFLHVTASLDIGCLSCWERLLACYNYWDMEYTRRYDWKSVRTKLACGDLQRWNISEAFGFRSLRVRKTENDFLARTPHWALPGCLKGDVSLFYCVTSLNLKNLLQPTPVVEGSCSLVAPPRDIWSGSPAVCGGFFLQNLHCRKSEKSSSIDPKQVHTGLVN